MAKLTFEQRQIAREITELPEDELTDRIAQMIDALNMAEQWLRIAPLSGPEHTRKSTLESIQKALGDGAGHPPGNKA